MSEMRINVEYKTLPQKRWGDSEKRAIHVIDRMQLRGVGIAQIKDAVRYGAKTMRNDGSIITKYRWYAIVYREFMLGELQKIYPITVLLDYET